MSGALGFSSCAVRTLGEKPRPTDMPTPFTFRASVGRAILGRARPDWSLMPGLSAEPILIASDMRSPLHGSHWRQLQPLGVTSALDRLGKRCRELLRRQDIL